MGSHRRFLLALLGSLVGSLVAAPSSVFASSLLTKPDGDVRVSEVRVAFSSSSLRTVAWEQLAIEEARGELAWLVAVPRGGWVEPGDEHFFESLDEATAPVIAPAKALECGAASESIAHPRGVPPRTISNTYASLAPAAAIEKLTSLGFVVDPATRASILALDALSEDLAILILPPGTRGVTRIARVLGPASRAFPLTVVPPSGARLAGFVLSSGRARFAGLPSGAVDPALLSWSGGKSNYASLLDATLEKVAPGAATVFAGSDGIFSDQPGGGTGATIPSLVRRYFTTPECAVRAAGFAASPRVVGPTCAKSSSWTSGLTPPGCAVATSEELPASQLMCGALDDLAVGASGHAPGRLVLTRLEGILASAPRGRVLELVGLGSIPSFHEAKVGPLCTASLGGGSSPTPNGQPTPVDPAPPGEPAAQPESSSSSGCSSTGQAFSDSCSRSSDSGDGCSGDSSSKDSCSGDSSSDGCSSGSGSSSSSGCDCKGASDAADDGCHSARARPRIRASAAMYLLIALAAIGRRFGRKSGYSSPDDDAGSASPTPCPTTTSSNEPVRG